MIFHKAKGIQIDGKKELCKRHPLVDYLNPKSVYIPLVHRNLKLEPQVKVGDLVKIGQIIAQFKTYASFITHASISGEVKSIKKVWHSSGKMVDAIEIENDHKNTLDENIKERKNIDDLSRDELIDIMKDAGLTGLGGAGFPSYIKYQTKEKIDSVIINAVECEPYITADYQFIMKFPEKLLKGATYMMRAADANEVVIAYKEYNKKIEEELNKLTDKYPHVKLSPLKDLYPAGWEKYVVEEVTGKTYKSLPAEAGVIVNNSATAIIYADAVEKGIPLISRPISITGEGINDPKTFFAPLGTKVSELIDQCGGYVEGLDPMQANYIAGGPMTGRAIFIDDLVIDDTLGSVIVKPFITWDYPECMGCGKCADVCPVYLTPTEIKKAFERKDVKLLDLLDANKCMQCGLCSYVCPSHVEISEAVGKGIDLLKKGAK
ncbi:MAG: RnfABCDGE type electron transport complex subunit C [Candidatus Izemoplasmatales bacterium]